MSAANLHAELVDLFDYSKKINPTDNADIKNMS